MPRTRFISLAVVLLVACPAWADGLIYRLPPDGAWVLYASQQQGELDYPDGAKRELSDEDKRATPRTAFDQGFLTIRSVGTAPAGREKGRWIELEQSSQVTGKSLAGTELEKGRRTIVIKLLIPENRLARGEDPFSHVVKMYFKDDDRKPEEITDARRRTYELDRFRPVFPAPGKAVKRLTRRPLVTASLIMGTLECEQLTFASSYDGPLAGGYGRWTWAGEHRLWLSDRVPFGVACLELDDTSTQGPGPKDTDVVTQKVTSKGTRRLVIAEMGTGARSGLAESK
jgi:hypothetical protein